MSKEIIDGNDDDYEFNDCYRLSFCFMFVFVFVFVVVCLACCVCVSMLVGCVRDLNK